MHVQHRTFNDTPRAPSSSKTWRVMLADVRKFFGIIHKDLKKGDRLVFEVTHQYNTYDFDGVKELLFTTAGPFGNRNLTFGIVWLVMGVLNGTITFVYIGLGWHQLWNPDRRVEDLRKRWAKGSKSFGMPHANPADMHTH
jgi:hypothetical protein